MSDISELVSFQILTPSHYQFSIFSQQIWLVITCRLQKEISKGVQSLPDCQLSSLLFEVDLWLLVIEMGIFLKVSGVGSITNSQICHISVDWWTLVIELVIFLKESGVVPKTNS